MNVSEFQNKLAGICQLAEENQKKLTGEQVRKYFEDTDLEKEQLLKILHYLKMKGITIEGTEVETEQDAAVEKQEKEESAVPLTEEEKAYLKEYMEGFASLSENGRTEEALFAALAEGDVLAQAELTQRYLPVAAEMAVSMNSSEIHLADLIQEANVSLLMAFSEQEPKEKDGKWIRDRIKEGIRQAISEQTERKFGDDCLVAKVQSLENAVKELEEDDGTGEIKFTTEELAVILDMDVDEIRGILRLTGDDK